MADTRDIPQQPRPDDAYLRDDTRVCPMADNTTRTPCWWVLHGTPMIGVDCACQPPPELWGRGR
jgi:hypothetical protein